jgi:hypothetical protein
MGKEFEEPAKRAETGLAATSDLELTEAIWGAAGAVRLAWDVFRSGPEYPATTSPFRDITDRRGDKVAKMAAAMAAVAPDDLAGAARAAGHVLGEIFPHTTPAENGVTDAVERLRYCAMTRVQLVRDSRAMTREWYAG